VGATRWWQSIAILRDRGGVREFQIAADLCSRPDPRRRELGTDILGELGRQERTFLCESVGLLIELLNDPDSTVLYSAIVALGNRKDPIAIPSLCKLARAISTLYK
jgi:HEAT repeat protein